MTTPSTETLWAYAKNELAPAEMAEVKAALDASPEARAALADVEASLAVLSLLPEPPPMPEVMARRVGVVLAEKADEAASRSLVGWWRAFFTPRFLLGAAAAAALAFGAFQLFGRPEAPGAGGGTGPIAEVKPPELAPLAPVAVPATPVKAVVASVRRASSGSKALQKAQVLESGARVATEKGGSLWLRLPDGTKAGLTSATEVQLATLEEKALTLEVTRGSLAMVVPHREDRVLIVRAGELEVKDLGTRFLVSRELAKTVVAVEEGSVEVKTPTTTHVVTAGHAVAWHEGELDAYTWPSVAPSAPPAPPTAVSPPVAMEVPEQRPTPVVEPTPDETDVEPVVAPEDEWAQPPANIAQSAVVPPAPPAPPLDAPPDSVVTVQPPGAPAFVPPRRRNSGFNLRAIEENLRELERQAHTPFIPFGSTTREAQARSVGRLADVGNCQVALEEADRWLTAPAGDALEEAPLKRMVLQQKVRCLNRLGRTEEAAQVQRLLVP